MTEIIINLIQSYFSGFFSSFIVLLVVYLIFWKSFTKILSKSKVQLVKRAGWDQIKTEIINSFGTTFVGTLISVTILSLYAQGSIKFYTDINMYGGLWYIAFSFVFLLFFGDAWFYFFHRLMHHPKVYKYVHAVHHQSLDTNPFTVSSFHIIESAILGSWIIPVAFVMPIYVPMLGVMQFVGLANNIKSHLGYEIYPLWFQKTWLKYLISSTHHNIHHTRYNGNYGLMFTFWDSLLGTEFKDTNTVFQQIKKRGSVFIKDNTKYHPVKISKIKQETEDTCSVYFENLAKEFYDYKAGQYINIRVRVNGKVYDRIFSLSSSPTEDNFLRITVKLNGPVTHHFFYSAKAGDTVEIMYPCGEFWVSPNSQVSKNYLFVAGGSGITPLYSMIKTLLSQEPNSKVQLLYASRKENSIIFRKELENLSKTFSNLAVTHYTSGQKRLNKTALELAISKKTDQECFVCGPKSLKSDTISNLKELGVVESNIHTEEFVEGYTEWKITLPSFKFIPE
jgi:ferredoxin-NADP reductase